MICKRCKGKIPKAKNKNRIKKIYCSDVCRTRDASMRRHDRLKGKKEYKIYVKKKFDEWYAKNKERQHQNCLNDYYGNKEKWNVRKFVWHNRKLILEILPKECFHCGKKTIKEIHHTTYNIKRPNKRLTAKQHKINLINYCQYLRGCCSRQCLIDFKKGVEK